MQLTDAPGGFTFSPDSTHDLIVGLLDNQQVVRYHNGVGTVLIGSGGTISTDTGITPSAILIEANGDLLVADFDFSGMHPTDHHRILLYHPTGANLTPELINITATGSDGKPLTPTSMMFDYDGNLLVGAGPSNHDGSGVIEKFSRADGHLISVVASGVGLPSGLAFVPAQRSDLLISNFDDSSVDRYSEDSHVPVPGGVAPSSNGLFEPFGAAVAPDGSYYVSSSGIVDPNDPQNFTPGVIQHYAADGTFEGDVFGDFDGMDPSKIVFLINPGTLEFGPNGNLYVADLGTSPIIGTPAIYQYDPVTQTWDDAATLSLGFTPAGFTFAQDGTRDLIVGVLTDSKVVRYHFDPTTFQYTSQVLISSDPADNAVVPAQPVNASSILALANGELLIADFSLTVFDNGHHQILIYDPNNGNPTLSQFINLTTPTGDTVPGGAPSAPQPTAIAFDHDGNLLVAVSPDHGHHGAIEKFDIDSRQLISTEITGMGTQSSLSFIPAIEPAVVGRDLFYHNSPAFDTTGTAQTPMANADDNAIATDKSALLPGQTTTFDNYSSYVFGVNGVMIDIAGLTATPTLDDFIFKAGNTTDPANWNAAPAPISSSVRVGAGVGGSTRITLVWADNAITGEWLQVTVKTTLGLAADDVFYFGNAPGESGNDSDNTFVDVSDFAGAGQSEEFSQSGHDHGSLRLRSRPLRRCHGLLDCPGFQYDVFNRPQALHSASHGGQPGQLGGRIRACLDSSARGHQRSSSPHQRLRWHRSALQSWIALPMHPTWLMLRSRRVRLK